MNSPILCTYNDQTAHNKKVKILMLIVAVLTVLKSKKVNICGPFPGCIFKVVDVYSRTFLSFVLFHFFRMFSLPNAVKKKKKLHIEAT